jgi:hypothetical protein
MSNATNITDITDLSDELLDAFLAFKAGDEEFNFSTLNTSQLHILQGLVCVDLSRWIRRAPAPCQAWRNRARRGEDRHDAIITRDEN